MKANQLGNAVCSYASILHGSDRIYLQEFGNAFRAGREATVAATVRKILTHWKVNNRPPASPDCMRQHLAPLADAVSEMGMGTPAKDFHALMTLFADSSNCAAEEFVKDIREGIEAVKVRAVRKKPTLNVQAVDHFATRLLRTSTDNAQFDQIVSEMVAAKTLKIVDLKEIARRFLGHETTTRSKKEIIKAIEKRQLQDALQSSRERRIERIAV